MVFILNGLRWGLLFATPVKISWRKNPTAKWLLPHPTGPQINPGVDVGRSPIKFSKVQCNKLLGTPKEALNSNCP